MNDDALIGAIKNGDAAARNAALRQLMKDPSVKGYIRQRCSDSQLGDDVLQESLVALDSAIRRGSFRQTSSLTTYLIGICRNMLSRQFKMAHQYVLQEDFSDGDVKGSDPADTPEDLVLMTEATEEVQRRDGLLRTLMGQISKRCCELLHLQYWDDLKPAQIGELRGQSNPQMVRNDMADCRQQLRRLIAKEPHLLKLFGVA
jgi:RNA polymerase sigma factor (sigma-70 family)